MREHLYGASVDKCVGGNIGKNLAFGDPLISSMTTEIILQKKITYLQKIWQIISKWVKSDAFNGGWVTEVNILQQIRIFGP